VSQLESLSQIEEKLNNLSLTAKNYIDNANTDEELDQLRVSLLGKKGDLSIILKTMGQLSAIDRPIVGQKANLIKINLQELITERKNKLNSEALDKKIKKEKIDVTIPSIGTPPGNKHHLISTQDEIIDIFCGLGYSVESGPEIETDFYNFESLNIPCITVPLSASTCAGWTALSNIYTKDGQFIKDVALGSCPKILVFDHKFIQTAPSRTLASGIADALAKWYESSITSSKIDDGLVQQAIQISRVLRDQLLIDGGKAFNGQFENNPSWQNTVEACGLTAGLVGGIGGEKCRTAAAHAIHNAITQIITPNKFLHGEIVGVGLLLQLRLEEMKNNNKLADQSIKQLLVLMKQLDLPTTISELGINVFENKNLEKIADFTCRDKSEIHFLPFEISKKDMIEVIASFEQQKIKI